MGDTPADPNGNQTPTNSTPPTNPTAGQEPTPATPPNPTQPTTPPSSPKLPDFTKIGDVKPETPPPVTPAPATPPLESAVNPIPDQTINPPMEAMPAPQNPVDNPASDIGSAPLPPVKPKGSMVKWIILIVLVLAIIGVVLYKYVFNTGTASDNSVTTINQAL